MVTSTKLVKHIKTILLVSPIAAALSVPWLCTSEALPLAESTAVAVSKPSQFSALFSLPPGSRLASFHVMDELPRGDGHVRCPGMYPVFFCDASDGGVMEKALAHVSLLSEWSSSSEKSKKQYQFRALLNKPKSVNPSPYNPALSVVKAAFGVRYRDVRSVGGNLLIVRSRVGDDLLRPQFQHLYLPFSVGSRYLRRVSEGVCTLPTGLSLELIWALVTTLDAASTVQEREAKLVALYRSFDGAVSFGDVQRLLQLMAKNTQLFSEELCHWAAYLALFLHKGSDVTTLKKEFSWIYSQAILVSWLASAAELYNNDSTRSSLNILSVLSAAVATDGASEVGSVADAASFCGTLAATESALETPAAPAPKRGCVLTSFYAKNSGCIQHPSDVPVFRFDAAEAPAVRAALVEAGYLVETHTLHGHSSRYFDSGPEYGVTLPGDGACRGSVEEVVSGVLSSSYEAVFIVESGFEQLCLPLSQYAKWFSAADGGVCHIKSTGSLDVLWVVMQALEHGPSVELREQKLRGFCRKLPRLLTADAVKLFLTSMAETPEAFSPDLGSWVAYLGLLLHEKAASRKVQKSLAWVYSNALIHDWFKQALKMYKSVGKRSSFDTFDSFYSDVVGCHGFETDDEESGYVPEVSELSGTYTVSVTEIVQLNKHGVRRTEKLKVVYMEGCQTEYITRVLLSGEAAWRDIAGAQVIIARECNFSDGAGLKAFVRNFPKLRHLYVNSCDIRSVPADLLAGVPLLEVLDLSSNGIKVIPVGFFAQTPYLYHVNLSSNQLTSIFDPMDTLERVSCFAASDNRLLGKFPDQFLARAERLQIFNVARCGLLATLPDSFLSRTHSALAYFLAPDTGLLGGEVKDMLHHRCPSLKRAIWPGETETALTSVHDTHLIAAFHRLVSERVSAVQCRYPILFKTVPVEPVAVAPARRSIEEVLTADEGGLEESFQKKVEEVLRHLHLAASLYGGLSSYSRFDEDKAREVAHGEAERAFAVARENRRAQAEAVVVQECAAAERLVFENSERRKMAAEQNSLAEQAVVECNTSAGVVIGLLQAFEPLFVALHRYCLLLGLMRGGLTEAEYRYAFGSFTGLDEDAVHTHYNPHAILDFFEQAKKSMLSEESYAALVDCFAVPELSERSLQLALLTRSSYAAMQTLMQSYKELRALVGVLECRLHERAPTELSTPAFLSADERQVCHQAGSIANTLFGVLVEALIKCEEPMRALHDAGAFGKEETPEGHAVFTRARIELGRCVAIAKRLAIS